MSARLRKVGVPRGWTQPNRFATAPALQRDHGGGKFFGRIAQLVEQLTLNQRVVGSSPTAPTKEIKKFINLERTHEALNFTFIELPIVGGETPRAAFQCDP